MTAEPTKTPPPSPPQGQSGGPAKPESKKGEAKLPEGLLPKGKTADDYKPENYDPESEYPEGDATKGKPDFQALAEGATEHVVMRDRRAYLISQAEKNQAANDEAQAQYIEGLKGTPQPIGLVNDPDFQRDKSMQQLELENEAAQADPKKWVEDYQKRRAQELKAMDQNRRAVEAATT